MNMEIRQIEIRQIVKFALIGAFLLITPFILYDFYFK